MRRRRAPAAGLLCALMVVAMAAGAHAATPRDQQWGLEQIGAPEAWESSRGQGTVVAIVDSGVDASHPDLAPRMLRDGDGRVVGRDEVDPGSEPHDEHGHGTLIAGVAAAAADAGVQGGGIAGVAPRARIMPVRVLDEDGMGTMSHLDAGIRWAVDNGADVINLSLESAAPVPGEVLATGPDDAVNYAWERGVPVVAAAGNTGTPFTDYRSSTPVLLVGASDRQDRRAAFSDAGRRDMVLAPGSDIIATSCGPCGQDPEHGYATASGTSLAAPHAAGSVAMLLAVGLDHEQALQRLRETAVEVSGGMGVSSGHGRIDVAAAMAATVDGQGGGGDSGGGQQSTGDGGSAPDDTEQRSTGDASSPSDDGAEPETGAASSDEPRDPEEAPAAETGSRDEPSGEREADEGDGEETEPAADDAGDAGTDDADGTDAAASPARGARGPDQAVDVPAGDRGEARLGPLEWLATGLLAVSLTAVVAVHRRRGLV